MGLRHQFCKAPPPIPPPHPGISAAHLRDAALALHRGGVGYYAASHFVHVDVGRVRRW
jgi:uncharacterized protein YcbK (DUF882 family)